MGHHDPEEKSGRDRVIRCIHSDEKSAWMPLLPLVSSALRLHCFGLMATPSETQY